MASYSFNDKQKLADAIALARSFSKTKPAKGKGKARPPVRQNQGRQLRSATRQQLTQSIVRPGALRPEVSHRQPPRDFQTRRQTAISMAKWQAEKNVPSVTGGRGLDFLSRKDATVSAPAVQPAVTSKAELPEILPHAAQDQPLELVTAPVSATTNSVLDEFFALMSQHEKDMAQVDPLVSKLQQWSMQSPEVTKPNTVSVPIVPPSPPAFVSLKQTPAAEPKAVFEPRVAVAPKVVVVPDDQRNGKNGIVANLPPKPPLVDISNLPTKPPAIIMGQQTSQLPLGYVSILPPKPLPDMRTTSLPEPSGISVALPPTDARMERPSKTIEQLMTPPQREEPAKCNCTPKIKPQKGLAASRFASKETESSPFANRFSVNLQIAIHQQSCPMFGEQRKSSPGQGKGTRNVQRALRADAEPFTPKSCKKLIANPGL